MCGVRAAGAEPVRRVHRARSRPAGDGPCPAGLASCRSLFDYDERGRDLVVALKYRNRRDVAAVLGAGMAALRRSGPRSTS